MIPVLTKKLAYNLDKDTIKSGHLSKEELMDNAGKAVAQFFCEEIQNPFSKTVVVVCGKGNNGGDGLITHSYLKKYNVSSKIVFIERNHGHLQLLKKYDISKSEYLIYNDKIKFDKYDWVVDSIFGIGLSRNLNKKYQKIIEDLNCNKNIISIDISSGLFIDNNKSKNFIKSKYIVTFGYPKFGHYIEPVNNLIIKNIGFKSISSNIQNIEFSDIKLIIKSLNKKNNIHKYSKGRVNIFAGSTKYTGAAILTSRAALNSGSGIVFLYWCSDNYDILHKIKAKYPDIVSDFYYNVIKSKEYESGNFCFGPGVLLNNKLKRIKGFFNTDNVVVDSGGFNYFSGFNNPEIINNISNSYFDSNAFPKGILTPHEGELKKIFKIKNKNFLDIQNLTEIQKSISTDHVVILKSFNTFIIAKDMIYIMDKGPSILATAGTGDVLSGILVSLLSQGYSRLEASILGTYLHAEAANYYMNTISKDGMTASDLIDCIPYAFNKIRQADEH